MDQLVAETTMIQGAAGEVLEVDFGSELVTDVGGGLGMGARPWGGEGPAPTTMLPHWEIFSRRCLQGGYCPKQRVSTPNRSSMG